MADKILDFPTSHAHKCKGCSHEWCHTDEWAATASEADYQKGHICSECGLEQYNRSQVGLRSCEKMPVVEPFQYPKRSSKPKDMIDEFLDSLTLSEILDLASIFGFNDGSERH